MAILLFAFLASVLALLYAAIQSFFVLREKDGNEKMQSIAKAIREGSNAFIKREYKTVFVLAFVIAVIVALVLPHGLVLALGFAIGAIGSALAGYIGMMVSVRANVKVAKKAEKGMHEAFRLAFKGGSVTGFAIVGFALVSLTLFYYAFGNPDLMFGFMFGASLISLFARVGGGIYTKGADVGADLVGKVGLNLPEDDPRNPAVIADNVGDNVGDCAGMGADLYETYVVTIISAMALAFALNLGQAFIVLPLAIGGMAAIATLIGTFFVKLSKNKTYIMGALYKGLVATTLISIIGFYFLTYYMMHSLALFYASIMGLVVMAVMVIVTEYYTGSKAKAVRKIAESSNAGAGVTIISGLGYALRSSFIPMLVIIAVILSSYYAVGGSLSLNNFGLGVYGIAITAVSMLSVAGMILSIDAFGPITDNAGGIAEMSNLPKSVRDITDPLDAVGNTTKAVTKTYAIGSAAIASLSLFAAYKANLTDMLGSLFIQQFQIFNPLVLAGLFVGATLPFLFTSFLTNSVGVAADGIVQEVKRQVKEIKGLLTGKARPLYGRCVDIVTVISLKNLVLPGLIAVLVPLAVGFILGPLALGGLLLGVILSGFALAFLMTISGAAWDNAKKYIELGNYGGKGSDAHKAAVVGDTVGDALKDTAGPAINPLIKVENTVSLLFLALIVMYHLL